MGRARREVKGFESSVCREGGLCKFYSPLKLTLFSKTEKEGLSQFLETYIFCSSL